MNMLARIPAHDDLTTLHDRVSRLVNDLVTDDANRTRPWAPRVDAMETADALLVNVELAGIDPATVETSLTGEYLEISGEAPEPAKVDGARWYRFERRFGGFRRRIQVPFPVDAENIEATFKHGLLSIRLPKKPEVLPRKIQVKVS